MSSRGGSVCYKCNQVSLVFFEIYLFNILLFLQPGHFARECPDGDSSSGEKKVNECIEILLSFCFIRWWRRWSRRIRRWTRFALGTSFKNIGIKSLNLFSRFVRWWKFVQRTRWRRFIWSVILLKKFFKKTKRKKIVF